MKILRYLKLLIPDESVSRMNPPAANEKFEMHVNKIVITELKSDSGVGNSSNEISIR